jgi:hypothetical protein
MTMLEVRDALWTVEFKGERVARTDTEKRLPRNLAWEDVDPKDVRSYLRWVEMEIFSVEPGQDDEQVGLPLGGYFYHVVHHTVCYHTSPPDCGWKGVPFTAGSADADLLPCRECNPPMLYDPNSPDLADPVLLTAPDLVVDVEPVRHDLYRLATPRELVARIKGKWLTMPASMLLEIARKNDPAINAVFARPGPPGSAAQGPVADA